MPTFYEGEPVAELNYKLTREDYEQAFLLADRWISPMHRRGVKAGISLCISALAASFIPAYLSWYETALVPISIIAAGIVCACFFLFVQPGLTKSYAGQMFSTNPLLGVENHIKIYRDSLQVKNQYETYGEYWTDFSRCVEDDSFFVLTGGVCRNLFIVPKKGLDEATKKTLSRHFENTFVAKYRRDGRHS